MACACRCASSGPVGVRKRSARTAGRGVAPARGWPPRRETQNSFIVTRIATTSRSPQRRVGPRWPAFEGERVMSWRSPTHILDRQSDMDLKNSRHCAFCLRSISGDAVKVCGGCHRRAYCSADCQRRDWTPRGEGQGHQYWCKLPCGEDVDWEIRHISDDKGLGIVAKRAFAADERILVERALRRDEIEGRAGVQELMPRDGSPDRKFGLNKLGSDGQEHLCVRLSRANHACWPNAVHWFSEEHGVKILMSLKPITAGEEITISYTGALNAEPVGLGIEASRMILEVKWGIRCPADCACRRPELVAEIERCRHLDEEIARLGRMFRSDEALVAVEGLLSAIDKLGFGMVSRRRALYDGFQIAAARKSTVEEAKRYARLACKAKELLFGPDAARSYRMFGVADSARFWTP
ncbi:hypothetical protein DFJ74DRAFT_477675 [Hyaloraphidium curvatum]|nr:hypothetical protein DFJ74DRAFT_477675 [Hyaloraphidium curvatum]